MKPPKLHPHALDLESREQNQLSFAEATDANCSAPGCGFATIIVGEDKKVFAVHETLLTHFSEFFRAALNGNFKEAMDKRITLEDEDPATFECFVHWLYYQKLPDTVLDGNGAPLIDWMSATGLNESDFLVHVYFLADKYSVRELCNKATTELLNRIRYGCTFPSAKTVLKVFDSFPSESAMPRLLIEAFGMYGESSCIAENEEFFQNAPFFQALMGCVMDRCSRLEERLDYEEEVDACDFHIHTTSEEKRRCRSR